MCFPAGSNSSSARSICVTFCAIRCADEECTPTKASNCHAHNGPLLNAWFERHDDPSRVCQLARHLVKNTLAVRLLAELHGLCCCGATLHDRILELVPPGSPSLIPAAARKAAFTSPVLNLSSRLARTCRARLLPRTEIVGAVPTDGPGIPAPRSEPWLSRCPSW